jgi:hypothetical protein
MNLTSEKGNNEFIINKTSNTTPTQPQNNLKKKFFPVHTKN